MPARADGPRTGVAQYAAFSLHAGIGVEAEQREKLERLTRYVSRPAVSEERLDLTAQREVRYRLKTAYRLLEMDWSRIAGRSTGEGTFMILS